MTVPVYIMEEHNEAYYYWQYFIEKGLIAKEGNYLLHVDHHDDLSPGTYQWDFQHMPQTLAEAKQFTYEKLGIADFIYPAIYKGMFATLHEMLKVKPAAYEEQKMILKGSKENLKPGKYIPFAHNGHLKEKDSQYKLFTKVTGGLLPLKIEQDFVLDLDLDYFCWDDSLKSVAQKRIEITEMAYHDFRENPYHAFRILPKRIFEVNQEGQKFYLKYTECTESKEIANEEIVLDRIKTFIGWLEENRLVPKVIDICRSRHSGYLPQEAFPWVEEEVLARLSSIMDIKIKKIGE